MTQRFERLLGPGTIGPVKRRNWRPWTPNEGPWAVMVGGDLCRLANGRLCYIRGHEDHRRPDNGAGACFEAEAGFGDLVKAVVDVERGIMAVDGAELIEFDSSIDIRPSPGNRSRGIDDPDIRELTIQVVESLVLP